MILGKGLQDKIKSMVLNLIDEKLGKRFPIIDEITDVFQEQENRFKDIEKQITKIKEEFDAKVSCCDKKDCC